MDKQLAQHRTQEQGSRIAAATHLNYEFAMYSELPLPLLVILICWLTVLFVSFGRFAPRNATVLSVLFVCACSMSAAVFLILEMNRPLDGLIKVSSAPLRNALDHLGH